MEIRQQIKQYCQQFRMNGIQSELDQLIVNAEKQNTGYLQFAQHLLQAEVNYREQSALANRRRLSGADGGAGRQGPVPQGL